MKAGSCVVAPMVGEHHSQELARAATSRKLLLLIYGPKTGLPLLPRYLIPQKKNTHYPVWHRACVASSPLLISQHFKFVWHTTR